MMRRSGSSVLVMLFMLTALPFSAANAASYTQEDLNQIKEAQDLMATKQYPKAIAMMESLKDKIPALKMVLGLIYLHGEGGTQKDEAEGVKLLEEAARAHGNETARLELGRYYMFGKPPNYEASRELLEKCSNPEALMLLGRMYKEGWGVEKNPVKAVTLLKQADAKGVKEARMYIDDGKAPDAVATTTTMSNATTSGSASSERPEKVANRISRVMNEVEDLVIRQFPRAAISKSVDSIHFEFKSSIRIVPGKHRQLKIPNTDGIVGDITVKNGKYAGKEILPLQTNETLYVSLLMAPYSKEGHCHLATELFFPPDTSVDFVNEFKTLVSNFEEH